MIKIGDFAKLFNVSIKTIRFYEDIGLFKPALVDIYTGYRYYDEKNIEELSKILFLKDLGLSLKEIKEFNMNNIDKKIIEYENKIKKLYSNINILKTLSDNNERREIIMKSFVNDEKAIGKWQLLGFAKNKDDIISRENDDYSIKELYLMENGQNYWVISWTKGYIYICDEPYSYDIENDLMFIKLHSKLDKKDFKLVVYKKVDSKKYTKEDFTIKDNIEVEFIEDKELIGFWKSIDVINHPSEMNLKRNLTKKENLYLEKITVSPDNKVIISYNDGENKNSSYTKNYLKNLCFDNTLCKYEIKQIENKTYLIVEWKSGDYIYGKMITCYYVLEKIT